LTHLADGKPRWRVEREFRGPFGPAPTKRVDRELSRIAVSGRMMQPTAYTWMTV
jgi:hypothetical protein